MTESFSTDVQPARPLPDVREALAGQLIAWRVLDYDRDAETQYGSRPRVAVDLLVCSGDKAGQRIPEFTTFGRLARELGEQDTGATLAARVVEWTRGRRSGYGLDYTLTADDIATVRAVIAATAAGARTSQAPGAVTGRTTEEPASSERRHASLPF